MRGPRVLPLNQIPNYNTTSDHLLAPLPAILTSRPTSRTIKYFHPPAPILLEFRVIRRWKKRRMGKLGHRYRARLRVSRTNELVGRKRMRETGAGNRARKKIKRVKEFWRKKIRLFTGKRNFTREESVYSGVSKESQSCNFLSLLFSRRYSSCDTVYRVCSIGNWFCTTLDLFANSVNSLRNFANTRHAAVTVLRVVLTRSFLVTSTPSLSTLTSIQLTSK